MASYGMTPNGFVPKRLADIQDSINENLADIVDPATGEFPFQNASDDTILQQIVGVFAEALSEVWDAAYVGSVQFDPLKNTGAGQSGTVQLNAIQRKPGAYTIVTLTLTGKQYTVVPAGSLVATASGEQVYATDEAVSIPESGTAQVTATATVKGPFEPAVGAVARIQTPVNGWNTASNTGTVAVGTLEETDEELRVRQQRSTYLTSYRLIDAIYAAVYNVPGVIYARAYQNTSAYPADDRGIPFKEVAVVAEGGDPRAIAEALFLRFPTGQIGYGNTTEVFYDMQGVACPISFTRPISVDIYVDVTIKITNRTEYPDNGADLIKQYIVDYAEYGGEGNTDGFPPGAEIILSRLYTPINKVPGHSVESLTIGTTAATTSNDIPIAWNKVGRFDVSRINVTVQAE